MAVQTVVDEHAGAALQGVLIAQVDRRLVQMRAGLGCKGDDGDCRQQEKKVLQAFHLASHPFRFRFGFVNRGIPGHQQEKQEVNH